MLRDFLARVRRSGHRTADRRRALAVVGIVAVASLPACGVKGPLTVPAPSAAPGAPSENAPAPTPKTPATRAPTSPLEPGPQPPSTAP
jgi:predicted small lipoprotein YifL